MTEVNVISLAQWITEHRSGKAEVVGSYSRCDRLFSVLFSYCSKKSENTLSLFKKVK